MLPSGIMTRLWFKPSG